MSMSIYFPSSLAYSIRWEVVLAQFETTQATNLELKLINDRIKHKISEILCFWIRSWQTNFMIKVIHLVNVESKKLEQLEHVPRALGSVHQNTIGMWNIAVLSVRHSPIHEITKDNYQVISVIMMTGKYLKVLLRYFWMDQTFHSWTVLKHSNVSLPGTSFDR